MCRQRPCKCSVDCFPVPRDYDFWHPEMRVGAFCFIDVVDAGNRYRELLIVLPCEGGELHGLPIAPAVISGWNKAAWNLSGTPEKPTLSPSVRTGERDHTKPDRPIVVEHWHGYLTNGRLVSC